MAEGLPKDFEVSTALPNLGCTRSETAGGHTADTHHAVGANCAPGVHCALAPRFTRVGEEKEKAIAHRTRNCVQKWEAKLIAKVKMRENFKRQ